MKQLIVRVSDAEFQEWKLYCESKNKSQKELLVASIQEYMSRNPLNELEQQIYDAKAKQLKET